MTAGYRALKQKAAWLDLSLRGKIAVHGPDRGRIMHALTTNDINGLDLNHGCYAFFLNAQGKVIADANVFSLAGRILLDTEPETGDLLFQHIDGYIIADDAAVDNLTGRIATIAVEGPAALDVMRAAGIPVPAEEYVIIDWDSGWVARVNSSGQPGCFLFIDPDSRDRVVTDLERAGAIKMTRDDARTVRIENGRPRYGEEISARYLAQETGQNHAIHPRKGCYLGQEVVERVRSRGLLGRVLVPVRFDTIDPPPPGSRLLSGEAPAGQVASAVYSPEMATAVGLAYVKKEIADGGEVLSCGPVQATVTPAKAVTDGPPVFCAPCCHAR